MPYNGKQFKGTGIAIDLIWLRKYGQKNTMTPMWLYQRSLSLLN